MKNRVLSLVFALCMLLGLMPGTAFAEDTDPVTITYTDGTTPEETWDGNNAKIITESCTVTVNSDYNQSGWLEVAQGVTVTIEGNSHIITKTPSPLFVFQSGAAVTVNNLTAQTTATGNNNLVQIKGAGVELSNANLTVADGDIFHIDGGSLTINSGTYTVQSVTPSYAYAAYAIYNDGGTLALKGGTIQTGGEKTLRNDGGTVTISGGTIRNTNTGSEGHALYNGANGTVTMTGGALESANSGSCVQNGTGCTFTISNGTITSKRTAISNSGTVNINGGTIKCTDGTAVYSGKIIMSDGTITAPKNSQNYCIKGNDITLSGGTLQGGEYGICYESSAQKLEISGSPSFSENAQGNIFAWKPFTLQNYTGDSLSVDIGQITETDTPKQVTTDGTAEGLKGKVTSTRPYYVGFDDDKKFIFFVNHQHQKAEDWTITETHHWHGCTKTQYCIAAGNNEMMPDYGEHNYSGWVKTDSEKHWKYCFQCGHKVDEAAHVYGDWQKDGSRHWKACACGKQSEGGPHVYDDKFDPDCNTCGRTRKVPYPTPVDGEGYTINYINETITVNSGYLVYAERNYSSKSFSTGDGITPGDTLNIIRHWDSTHNNSAWAPLPIPERPAAPTANDFTVTQPALAGDKGSIAGITAAMEYSTDNGTSWTTGDGSELSGLAEGAEVLVRVKATNSSFKSESYTVTVGTGAERTYVLTVTAPAFDPVFPDYAQPAAKPITIKNTGNSAAVISSVALSGENADSFILTGTDTSVPAGGELRTYSIQPRDKLSVGTYTAAITVTYENSDVPAEASVSFTVKEPVYYTAAFNSQGGSAVESQSVIEGGAVSKPAPDPTRSGYTFGGWYTEAGCVHRWDFVNGKVTGDLTLYARWVKNTYSISGTVKDKDGKGIDNVRVKLVQGNTVIDNYTTADGGKYSFSGVAPGSYNVVAEQMESGAVSKTMTILVEIKASDAADQDLQMPADKVNSVLVVKSDSGITTPDVVVGDLDKEAEAVKAAEGSVPSVTVTMTVESKEETNASNSDDIEEIAAGKTLEYLDIKVQKTVTPSTGSPTTTDIPVTKKLLTIIIPFDPSNKSDVAVYRYHTDDGQPAGQAEALSSSASDEEYFEVGPDSVTIHARKFSTYAIGYKTGTKPEAGGFSGTTYYVLTAAAGEGGSISPSGKVSVVQGGSKRFTITPAEGYAVADVLVDGKSVGAVSEYTFEKVNKVHTIEASFKKAGNDYSQCPKDETCPIWPYTDASTTAWYHDGVHYCIDKGLMTGYGNGVFGPDDSLSRAMLAQILYNEAGRPAVSGSSPFEDVDPGAWYSKAITWAASRRIAKGYGDGVFGPNDPITREQLAVMLYRREQAQGGGFEGGWTFILDFTDREEVSEWAYEAMCWMTMNGIITGKENKILDPTGPAARAEAAAMLQRYLEK